MFIIDIGYKNGQWIPLEKFDDYVLLANTHLAMQQTPGQSIITMETFITTPNPLATLKGDEPLYILSHGNYGLLGNGHIPAETLLKPTEGTPEVKAILHKKIFGKAPSEIKNKDGSIQGFGEILANRILAAHAHPPIIHLSCSAAISDSKDLASLVEGTAKALEAKDLKGIKITGFVGDGLSPGEGITTPKPFSEAYYEDGKGYRPTKGKEEKYANKAKKLVRARIKKCKKAGKEYGQEEVEEIAKITFDDTQQYFKDMVEANRILCAAYPVGEGTLSVTSGEPAIYDIDKKYSDTAAMLYSYIHRLKPAEIKVSNGDVRKYVEFGREHALETLKNEYFKSKRHLVISKTFSQEDCLKKLRELYPTGFQSTPGLTQHVSATLDSEPGPAGTYGAGSAEDEHDESKTSTATDTATPQTPATIQSPPATKQKPKTAREQYERASKRSRTEQSESYPTSTRTPTPSTTTTQTPTSTTTTLPPTSATTTTTAPAEKSDEPDDTPTPGSRRPG